MPNKQCALNNDVRLMTQFYGRSKECVSLAVQLQFVCRWLLTGGTVIPVSLIAVVPTVLENCVLRISHCCICFPWTTDTVCSLLFSNN